LFVCIQQAQQGSSPTDMVDPSPAPATEPADPPVECTHTAASPPAQTEDVSNAPPAEITLTGLLARVGPEFDGLVQTVAETLGSDDVEEILGFVKSRQDLSDLDDAGIDTAAVNKLFACIQEIQGTSTVETPQQVPAPEPAQQPTNTVETPAASPAAPEQNALVAFLAQVGPEFDGLSQTVADALGSDDVQEILSFVESREDLSDLDSVGIDASSVDKLFAYMNSVKQAPASNANANTLAGLLSRVGPEFDGLVEKVAEAFGSNDVEEILDFVTSREDLSDLEAVGIDASSLDKLYAVISQEKESSGPV